jgi:WD40 repeat protein/tRNA A-37 threonylcarbamoyl transferase component Bud32
MADRRGQQFGNYRLDRLLGRGAFAEVYLGEHIYLGTPAAVKLLTTRFSPDEVKNFLTEARTLVRLKHANIVQVLDFGLEGDTPFLVMSYAPNGALRTRHPPGTKLTPITILPYVQQIASALQYAHNQQLIHRDVKPENMLVGVYSEILLSDFGIALPAQASGEQNTVSSDGTVAYMAPEQCEGHPCFASDQYSLGVVMYEWLTGERPFHGSFVQIAYQHIHAAPVPLRDKAPELSPAFNWIVMTALHKNPQQRFPSINNLADAFTGGCLPSQADTTRRVYPMSAALPLAPSPKQWKPPVPGTDTPTVSVSEMPTREAPPSRGGRRFSRRLFLLITAGAALTGAGVLVGYEFYASLHHSPGAAATSRVTPTSQPGTTLLTYQEHSPSKVYALAWSPDSTRIASASADKTVRVWDAGIGKTLFTFTGHKPMSKDTGVDAVAWSPDGKMIVSGGSDNTVRVWEAANGKEMYSWTISDNVEGVAWSNDGNRIAAACDDRQVYIWNARTGEPFAVYSGGHQKEVLAVAWSPDNHLLASVSADASALVWDTRSGAPLIRYSGHGASVNAVAWSPDGEYIVTGSSDSTVQVWKPAVGGHLTTYQGHNHPVDSVAWSRDGKYVVSSGQDKTAQIWEAASGSYRLTYSGQDAAVLAVAWSFDNTRIASGCSDGSVQVWRALTS